MRDLAKLRPALVNPDSVDNRIVEQIGRVNKVLVLVALLENRRELLPIPARHVEVDVVVPGNETLVPSSAKDGSASQGDGKAQLHRKGYHVSRDKHHLFMQAIELFVRDLMQRDRSLPRALYVVV